MARRWLVLFAALALSGCAGGGSPPSSVTQDDRPRPQRFDEARLTSTITICAVGERPDYFVPGSPDGLLALLGCARLGVGGKRVEFSGNLAQIDGARHACINPAHSGRGQRGFYIPAICALEPSLSRFAVRAAAQPRQGVRGYAFVIWGTTGPSTDVVARFAGGTARAAVFQVPPGLARSFGESPFGLFVVELPLSAACTPVTVTGDGPDATERIPPRGEPCGRGPDSGPVGAERRDSRPSSPEDGIGWLGNRFSEAADADGGFVVLG